MRTRKFSTILHDHKSEHPPNERATAQFVQTNIDRYYIAHLKEAAGRHFNHLVAAPEGTLEGAESEDFTTSSDSDAAAGGARLLAPKKIVVVVEMGLASNQYANETG